MNRNDFNWKANTYLAVFVIVLWSFGRIINPLTHAELDATQTVGPLLGFFVVLYVALHALLFLYVCWLVACFFRRSGVRVKGMMWWQLLLYVYVLATLLLSVYFIAYEFGYLPQTLQALVPLAGS